MIPGKKFRLHFVGIGGIGMSGIAEIFLRQGHQVSGSDLHSNEQTERLEQAGARIFTGHSAHHIQEVHPQTVVMSSAVRSDNPEVVEARRLRIPVIPRAEMLAEIMRGKTGISVAGTHGKTTTTSMVAQVLMHAGLDPTVVVGGKVEAIGSNAKMGTGEHVVAEADESDGSFLLLPTTYAIVTNVDFDHMEFYQTQQRLDDAFVRFVKGIPFYGCAWMCADDPGVQRILGLMSKPVMTYGISSRNADLVARDIEVTPQGQRAQVYLRGNLLGTLELGVLGRHNLLNALAAIGLGHSLGLSFSAAQLALKSFRHVRRRFDQRYWNEDQQIRVVDDYGHHPTEVSAVLATAHQVTAKRRVTVFQPHRYSRTQLCWDDFVRCFSQTDVLILLPIYAAGETEILGVHHHTLGEAIRKSAQAPKQVRTVESLDEAQQLVLSLVQPGDLVLTLGAGTVTQLAGRLAEQLSEKFRS